MWGAVQDHLDEDEKRRAHEDDGTATDADMSQPEPRIPIQYRPLGRFSGPAFWKNWDGDTSKLPDHIFDTLCHTIIQDKARRNRLAQVTFVDKKEQGDLETTSEGRGSASPGL